MNYNNRRPAVCIPARYNSSRLPGKPLIDLGGKPMIERVIDNCLESDFDVFVLTDDKRISDAVKDIGKCEVLLDSKSQAQNGTHRCQLAYNTDMFLDYDTIVNVQGDNPDMPGEFVHRVLELLTFRVHLATLYTDLYEDDRNTAKVVHNNRFAHWFSRDFTKGDKHLGIYAYDGSAIDNYPIAKSSYESMEDLEQLRWYTENYRIAIQYVEFDGIEINTEEDVKRWHEKHSNKKVKG